MQSIFTKGQIDRLGNRVREENLQIEDSTLNELQQYRISHEEPLSKVFSLLCSLARSIHPTSIATFRVKRFESIMGKLERYPGMRFSRMWDIGGCRCIVRNETDVYKLMGLLEASKDLEILKNNDYIKEPQESGYKSLHLYVKHSCSEMPIEIQLRSLSNHDWATLVEITDLLFDTRLKEIGDNEDLFKLHKLLSNRESLTNNDKQKIFEIIKKYDFFGKLSEVFARNYLRVRNQWLSVESKDHKYFLIEARKDDVPKIISFDKYFEAEENYFNLYKNTENGNIVLTYIQNHNYNLIATAYANYILTFHSFMNDCLTLFESLLFEFVREKRFLKFARLYGFWNELAFTHSKNLVSEIDEVVDSSSAKDSKNSKIRNKRIKEWIKDINKQVEFSNKNRRRLTFGLYKNLPKKFPSKFICGFIIRKIDKDTRNKIKHVFRNSRLFKEYGNKI